MVGDIFVPFGAPAAASIFWHLLLASSPNASRSSICCSTLTFANNLMSFQMQVTSTNIDMPTSIANRRTMKICLSMIPWLLCLLCCKYYFHIFSGTLLLAHQSLYLPYTSLEQVNNIWYTRTINKSVMTYIVLLVHTYQWIRALRYYHAASKCIYQFIWCKLEQNHYYFPYQILRYVFQM